MGCFVPLRSPYPSRASSPCARDDASYLRLEMATVPLISIRTIGISGADATENICSLSGRSSISRMRGAALTGFGYVRQRSHLARPLRRLLLYPSRA